MPIRPEIRKHYRTKEFNATRQRIRERAGNKCEFCKVPNGLKVVRYPKEFPGWWFDYETGKGYNEKGEHVAIVRASSELPPVFAFSTILLGMAHLNHDHTDNRDENLAYLCGRCHLMHDRLKHKETRATRKDLNRPLLRQMIA
jgi:hypothetical protein